MSRMYQVQQPDRQEIAASSGAVALDFGTNWCGYCTGAAPHIEQALSAYPAIRHIKVEDGPGRVLGRSFKVKLWPTVVVLKDGVEVGRVVRPEDPEEVTAELAKAL
jgi:thioredoxin 1